MNKKIGISILNSNLLNIESELKHLKEIGVKNIHLDIADTSFVNNISFGPAIVNKILEYDFEFDIHLMVKNPLIVVKQLTLKSNVTVCIHYESINIDETFEHIIKKAGNTGIVFNPCSDIVKYTKHRINKVVLMLVNPGHGAQTMLESAIPKIDIAKKLFPFSEVVVDGGVNKYTIFSVKNADYFVVGSSFFANKIEERKAFLEDLYNKIM